MSWSKPGKTTAQVQVTGNYLTCPKWGSDLGSNEKEQAVSGNAIDHPTIKNPVKPAIGLSRFNQGVSCSGQRYNLPIDPNSPKHIELCRPEEPRRPIFRSWSISFYTHLYLSFVDFHHLQYRRPSLEYSCLCLPP